MTVVWILLVVFVLLGLLGVLVVIGAGVSRRRGR